MSPNTDEEIAGRVALLYAAVKASALLTLSWLVGEIFLSYANRHSVDQVAVFTASCAALALFAVFIPLRRGRFISAAWAYLLISTIAVTIGPTLRYWPQAPVVAMYALIVVIAGLTLNLHAAAVLGLLHALILLIAQLLSADGRLPENTAPNGIRWFSSLTLLICAAWIAAASRSDTNRLVQRLKRELADRRRAESALAYSEERLRSLLAALPDFVLTFTPDGDFADVFTQDHIHETRIGMLHGVLVGRTLSEVFTPAQAARFQAVIEKAIATHEVLDYQYSLIAPEGETYWYEARIAAYTAPEGTRVAWLARDVTAHIRTEQELRAFSDDLEARIHERTARLEDVNRELEAFTYSVSHDLRAPLRAVTGYAQLLEEDHAVVLPADGKELLANVRRAANQMGSIIESLLRLSRLANLPLERSEVDMATAASEAARILLESSGKKSNLHLTIEPMPPVFADPALIQRVYANLLENAIKFSRRSSLPKVIVGFHDIDGEAVYYVRDNGVGFDPRQAADIFSAFNRLHSSFDFEGVGLGLAITRRIIERHGGRIWADSQPDRGAVFYFTLPLLATVMPGNGQAILDTRRLPEE